MQILNRHFRTKINHISGFIQLNLIHCNYRFSSQFKILFYGTDDFSLSSLKILANDKNESVSRLEVVTSFKSRQNKVKTYAERNKIRVHDYAVLKHNMDLCRTFDLGVVVSFGHLIPESMIECFKNGMINVHASLLPQYRGASPIIYAIKDSMRSTGVSIMKITPNKFDVGDILAQKEVPIDEDILMPELHDQLADIGANLLLKTIQNFDTIIPIKQNDSLASYAPKIENDFCKVRWHEMTSTQVYDLYRALYSFKPILTSFKTEQVKLLEVSKSNSLDLHIAPGYIKYLWKTKRIAVGCADGKAIEVGKLVLYRKTMSASDFQNGFLTKIARDDEKKFEE